MPAMDMHDRGRPWWRTRSGIVLCGFLLITAFYLLTEHTAHVFGVLPFLFILACPLMHLFMHHGHGSDSSGHAGKGDAS
jgi:peptidoglycan/LPS O-acetylase OafA/YrhL